MKSPATYAGDPRHHADDLAELRAENATLHDLVDALRDDVARITRSRDEWEANEAAAAKTVIDLAFAAWHGTQRCADCRFANAVRRGVSAYCGRCLHTLDLLTAAGFADLMSEWGGS